MSQRPDPAAEIRLVSLTTLRGANYWSRCPITRLDLVVGAYDHISSADVAGLGGGLLRLLPGLREHRCSVGEPGGFVLRMREGTYAPHILEHVALELQAMIGHDVGYGRARGGDRPGEYTVVFEHLHGEVGRRAASGALQVVQAAFAGRFDGVDPLLGELRALAVMADPGERERHVACGVIGGQDRAAVREAILGWCNGAAGPIIELGPAVVLATGLPYRTSDVAVILDVDPRGMPGRYREPSRARRLHGVVADAVEEGGFVVVPAGDAELQRIVAEAGARIATFGIRDPDRPAAELHARLAEGRIAVLERDLVLRTFEPDPHLPSEPQLAGALAVHILERLTPATR
jgi:hypothetical protein